jgi:uncharacterized protein DUF1874
MSTMYLLNSAVITSFNTFRYTPLTLEDAKFLLQNRLWESAIGYEATADAISTLTGVSISVNRQEITMQEDDSAIVFRLKFRADPTKKGEYTADFIAGNCEIGFLRCIGEPNEIVSLALRIAERQRGENHVQPLTTIIAKYEQEKRELEEAGEIWDELPDIYYYSTVGYQVYGWFPLLDDMHKTALLHDVSWRDMKKACIAKYRRRAAGHAKDIEAERAAIMRAIAE